jgi:hypothetical protein
MTRPKRRSEGTGLNLYLLRMPPERLYKRPAALDFLLLVSAAGSCLLILSRPPLIYYPEMLV